MSRVGDVEYLESAYISVDNAKYYSHPGKQLTVRLYRCHSFLKTSKKNTQAWSLSSPPRIWGRGPA